MIADLILAVLDRLDERRPFFWPYSDNDAKRNAYLRRSADYSGSDPDEYQRRYMAGLAVKRRVRQGPRKLLRVVKPNTDKAARAAKGIRA